MALPVTLPQGGSLGPPVPSLQDLACLSLWVPPACSPQLSVAAGSSGQGHQSVKDVLAGRGGVFHDQWPREERLKSQED